jgi:hypothetical protein
LFTEREAARKIFERWRERFGPVDEQNDIYVAVVRGISAKNPTHYRVMVTSRLQPDVDIDSRQQLLITSRIQTMEPASDANLTKFLDIYRQAGAYLLVPAIWEGEGQPEFLFDVALLKRDLTVKAASEVGEHDIEAIALGSVCD